MNCPLDDHVVIILPGNLVSNDQQVEARKSKSAGHYSDSWPSALLSEIWRWMSTSSQAATLQDAAVIAFDVGIMSGTHHKTHEINGSPRQR